jgi:ParB-like chromosome segregation protein Spo0J
MRANDERTFSEVPATAIGLAERVVPRKTVELKAFPKNARVHTRQQIAKLAKSISAGWTNPILTDEAGTILAGHGRWQAAKKLGLIEVPTLTICGLSEAQKKAIVIADNRLAEDSTWDFGLLREHIHDLIEVDLTSSSPASAPAKLIF